MNISNRQNFLAYSRLALIITTALFAGTLIIMGMSSYPGSKLVYALFSTTFWLLLVSAFGKRTYYGYFFLSVALWLGFWVKLTAHLLLDYPYVEPIGQFDGSSTAWDSVLWVAISASVGVMLGKLLFSWIGKKYSRIVSLDKAKIPKWYPAHRTWIWALTLTAIIGIATVNLILGIQQIGLTPRTILPWPLNALIAWQVSIGSALLLTVLLWWEMSLKKSLAVSVFAILIEAITSTVSLLSRGVYIFHTLPQLFSLFENRRSLIGVSKVRVVLLLLVFTGLMVISISGVTTFRAYMYPHVGGFTTEDQQRVTRLEVIEGGIARVKVLIFQGEPQEGHLLDLLRERAQLLRQKKEARLEVLEGGIARVKLLISQGEKQEGHLLDLLKERAQLLRQRKEGRLEVLEDEIADVKVLISKGERQEGHLSDLLSKKAQLEKILSKTESQEEVVGEWQAMKAQLEQQKQLARLEVLEGGIARVKILISQGEKQEGHLSDLLSEKAQLEKSLFKKPPGEALRERNAIKVQLENQKQLARVEVLESSIAGVKILISQGEKQERQLSDLVSEKTNLEKVLLKKGIKRDSVVESVKTEQVKNVTNVVTNSASVLADKNKLLGELYFQLGTGALPRILTLVVDRWVGLEGVMAVHAYPDKSNKLLFDAAKEKREIGKVTKYQEICNSHYRWADAKNFQFASLPGAIAFLYFSGSLWIVILGMAVFALVLQLGEQLVFILTSNPLFCSMFGLTVANTITQFGITPRQDIPFYSMIIGFVIFVSIVQSDVVYQFLLKHLFRRGNRSAV